MDLTAVAVAADFIGLARGEVEGPGNLLVKENVADGMKDVRIEPEREFANETGAGIGIKNGIQLGRIPAGRATDDPFGDEPLRDDRLDQRDEQMEESAAETDDGFDQRDRNSEEAAAELDDRLDQIDAQQEREAAGGF